MNYFEKYFEISFGICKRLTGLFGTKDYVNELDTIRTCRMEVDPEVILTEKVNEAIKMNKETFIFFGKETKNNDGRKRKNTKEEKQQDSECSEFDYFFRNIQGNAILPTVHAMDLMQTEIHGVGVSRKNRRIGGRGG